MYMTWEAFFLFCSMIIALLVFISGYNKKR